MKIEQCPPTWEATAAIHTEVLLNKHADPVTVQNAQLALVDMGRRIDKLHAFVQYQRERGTTFTEETHNEEG
jgi:hypothetical protein